ncbi:unnamed protein product [Hymenolepis diminuta]|uniref:Uncharacterized protein n=1 Tax=Hymenolepis diminuta TaxID=6216 RepID=A0A564Y0P3_HYMDI|nr:unnamed protein product [Hymenolepis diminuta]
MTINREIERLGWECLKGCETGPSTRFVRIQQKTPCDLLCFTAFPSNLGR